MPTTVNSFRFFLSPDATSYHAKRTVRIELLVGLPRLVRTSNVGLCLWLFFTILLFRNVFQIHFSSHFYKLCSPSVLTAPRVIFLVDFERLATMFSDVGLVQRKIKVSFPRNYWFCFESNSLSLFLSLIFSSSTSSNIHFSSKEVLVRLATALRVPQPLVFKSTAVLASLHLYLSKRISPTK